MPKVTKRNRDRITIDLKKEEIEMMMFLLKIAEPQVKGNLEAFVFKMWDAMRFLPEAEEVIKQVGDM